MLSNQFRHSHEYFTCFDITVLQIVETKSDLDKRVPILRIPQS